MERHEKAEASPSQADMVSRLERRHRRGLGVVCFLATMTGLLGGYWLTETERPRAPVAAVVPVAEVDVSQRQIRAELERQASQLTSTKVAVDKVAVRQVAFEQETHAKQASLNQDLADLSDRTKKAQARTDAKVYHLGEAMKLIDWATSGGYASKVTASLP